MAMTWEDIERPTVEDEADRLICYWEQHGDDPEAVSRWAVADLLQLCRQIVDSQD